MAKILTVVGEGVWRADQTINSVLSALDYGSVGAKDDDGFSTSENEITGTKYYFSTSGDDANDGLSPSTPKKTFRRAKITFSSMNAGDGILFKRGDVWSSETEDLSTLGYAVNGTAGNPKVLTCYGLGNRPKFSGLVTQSVTWTDNGDGTWKHLPTFSPTTRIRTMLVDGNFTLDASDLAELKSDAKWKFFHDFAGTGEIYTSFDPSAHTIQWSDHLQIWRLKDCSYLSIKHLEFEHSRNAGFTMENSAYSELAYITTGYGCYTGLTARGINMKMHNNIVDSGQPLFDYAGSQESVHGGFEGIRIPSQSGDDNMEIYNNTTRNWAHGNIKIEGSTGVEPVAQNCRVHHNMIDGRNILYGGKFSVYGNIQVEFYNNIDIGGDGNQLSEDNCHYHHNLFIKKLNSPLGTAPYNNGCAMQTNIRTSFSSNIFEHNIFYNCDGGGFRIVAKEVGEAIDGNIIRKNVFLETGNDPILYPNTPEDIALYFSDDSTEIKNTVVQDNVIFKSNNNQKVIVFTPNEGATGNAENIYTIAEAEAAPIGNNNVFSGNVYKDPEFLSPTDLDFRAQIDTVVESYGLLDGFGIEPTIRGVTFTPEAGFTQSPTPIKYTVKNTSGTLSNLATITVNYN